jgi:hypothetical protein
MRQRTGNERFLRELQELRQLMSYLFLQAVHSLRYVGLRVVEDDRRRVVQALHLTLLLLRILIVLVLPLQEVLVRGDVIEQHRVRGTAAPSDGRIASLFLVQRLWRIKNKRDDSTGRQGKDWSNAKVSLLVSKLNEFQELLLFSFTRDEIWGKKR